jgi:hypothetical protein
MSPKTSHPRNRAIRATGRNLPKETGKSPGNLIDMSEPNHRIAPKPRNAVEVKR